MASGLSIEVEMSLARTVRNSLLAKRNDRTSDVDNLRAEAFGAPFSFTSTDNADMKET